MRFALADFRRWRRVASSRPCTSESARRVGRPGRRRSSRRRLAEEPEPTLRRVFAAAGIAVALLRAVSVAQEAPLLPNRPGSLKFAAIGDNGTGDQPQYDVAAQMERWHQRFGFDMVIMLGDN